jgi:hypothetical protein
LDSNQKGYVENTNPNIGILGNPDQLVPLVRPNHHERKRGTEEEERRSGKGKKK